MKGARDEEKNIIIAILVSVVLLTLFFIFNEGTPNKKQILQDFKATGKEELNGFTYTINKLDIEKSKVDNNYAQYWCKVEMENEYYKITASAIATYGYYTKGGWNVENISDYSNIIYKAKTGVSDTKIREITDCYSNLGLTVSNIKHDTNLKQGVDYITIDVYNEGKMMTTYGTGNMSYNFNELEGWEYNRDFKYKYTSGKLSPTGIWSNHAENYNSTTYYSFEDYSENSMTFTIYLFNPMSKTYYSRTKTVENIDTTITDECIVIDDYLKIYSDGPVFGWFGTAPEEISETTLENRKKNYEYGGTLSW